MQDPTSGIEIIPADLGKAWELPARPVEVWEEEAAPGWSAYTIAGGSARLVVMETITPAMPRPLVLAALARAIANASGICPACSARFDLRAGTHDGRPVDGFMEHETACPVADDGLREAAAGIVGTAALPALPRVWVVWVPRLRQGYRPRRWFTDD